MTTPGFSSKQKPRPLEIRYSKAERVLEVDFDDGQQFQLPAELLRVESPSAEVQGHSYAEKQIIGGKRFVGITEIEPVGNYAVRLRFDDSHDTGIYSWDTLYEFGLNKDKLLEQYLKAVEQQGLNRDL